MLQQIFKSLISSEHSCFFSAMSYDVAGGDGRSIVVITCNTVHQQKDMIVLIILTFIFLMPVTNFFYNDHRCYLQIVLSPNSWGFCILRSLYCASIHIEEKYLINRLSCSLIYSEIAHVEVLILNFHYSSMPLTILMMKGRQPNAFWLPTFPLIAHDGQLPVIVLSYFCPQILILFA